jgi:hypothetical protein
LRSLEIQQTCWKSLERRRKHGENHFSDVVNMLEITGETEACWRSLERVTWTHIIKKYAARLWTGGASCGPVGGSCEIMFDYSVKRFVYGMISVRKSYR